MVDTDTGLSSTDLTQQPLSHLRVVDLTVMLPGPLVTRILAQHGAQVVKIEHLPAGDPMRGLETSSLWEMLNQGKRSLALDLKAPESTAIIGRLCAESDVIIENMREGVMDQLGLSYAELSRNNPDLLYVSLRGFVGDRARQVGHDLNFIATSGVGEWFLENGHANHSTLFGDLIGGALVPAMRVLSQLCSTHRRGMHLVTHMDEGFRFLYLPRAYDTVAGERREEGASYGLHQSMDGRSPHSGFYRCNDGCWISLNAIQSKHWDKLCEVISQPEWKMRQADESLIPELARCFAEQSSVYWDALNAQHGFCLFRVVPWKEYLEKSGARQTLSQDPLEWVGFQSHPDLVGAPALGQDSNSILSEAGFSREQIQSLASQGVLLQSESANPRKDRNLLLFDE